MESKVFECNAELEAIFMRYGFTEATDAIDKLRGKKEFRRGRSLRMVIRFDYKNFVMFEGGSGCPGIGGSSIDVADLQLLLWYIGSNARDREAISDGHFNLQRVRNSYKTMSSLLGFHREFNTHSRESQKFERLLSNYHAIQAN